MSDLNFYLNCSVTMDYLWTNIVESNSELNESILKSKVPMNYLWTNVTSGPNLEDNLQVSTIESKVFSAERVGVILASMLINVFIHFGFCKSYPDGVLKRRFFNSKTITRAIVLVVLLLTLPILLSLLALALCYKIVCSVIIRRDKYFVGFLDSFDVFWSLEDEATINVIGVIESDSPETLVESIKMKLQNITISNNGVDKIFYRRSEEYGLYYWRRYNVIDVSQYVEVLDLPDTRELSVVDLEDVMVQVSNESLPYDDEGLFKIFVTKQRVGKYDGETGEYGIIFVIHHSVGDGVALLEFLCKTLADKRENHPVNMFSMPEAKNYDSPTALMDMIKKLWEIPLCFVNTIVRKPDESALHGPSLLGQKVFKWTESDENLLLMVKEIKDNVDDLSFSDVLVTALSGGLRNYFTKTMAHVPEDVAVIVPVRFPKSSSIYSDSCLMKNDFSVTILDVPVNNRNLEEIKNRCHALRKSVDAVFNHYFIKLITVLPKQILRPLLNSNQATLVFSNMPGPDALTICEGNALKELVFFVPHKGNTGLDVTALCYGGVLRFAASADRALVPDSEHLSLLLDGMVEEIKRLHREYARN